MILVFISFWVIGTTATMLGFKSSDSSVSNTNQNSNNGNSQQQNTYTPPAQTSKTWHYVTSFSGDNYKTTDTFHIQGDKFKLTYTTEESNDYATFSFFVYPDGETQIYAEAIIGDIGSSGTDSTISYAGEGSYYLKIIAGNLDSWEIKVEDYY